MPGRLVERQILLAGYKTVEIFAHENSIAKSTLSQIINGTRDPRFTTLLKIAKALEITVWELLKPIS